MEVNVLPASSYANLRAFQGASALDSEIFWITRHFPQEVPYGLTDQLRRTARAICENVIQGWNLRYCAASFRGHLDEAQSACARLGLWLDFAHQGCYLTEDDYEDLLARKTEVQQMLNRLFEHRITLLA